MCDPTWGGSAGRSVHSVREFTQRQVNESRVIYEHNTPFSNITVYDTLSLEARTDFAIRRIDVNLRIRISVAFQVNISRLETVVSSKCFRMSIISGKGLCT